jgi:hypothetical protein
MFQSVRLEIESGEFLVRFQKVDEVVWNPLPVFVRDLGGTDIEIFINLHGIGADNFCVKFFSECDCCFAFL